MLNNYKGNSAHLKALKLARIEQYIADAVVWLSLSLGVVAMFTFCLLYTSDAADE